MGAIGNFLLRYNAALLALLFLCKNLETPLVVLIKGYFATYLLIRVSRVRVAGGSPFLFYGTLHCNLCYGAFYVIMKKVYVFRDDNLAKRAVYNGYEEAYMSGLEIKEFLSDAYGTFGRHHERVSSTRIKIDTFKKIKMDKIYRIFYNDCFFKIMDGETDASLYFLGYTKVKPKWAKD